MGTRHGRWIARLLVLVLVVSAAASLAHPTPPASPESAALASAPQSAAAPRAPSPAAVAGNPGTWTRVSGNLPDRGYIRMVYDNAASVFVTHGGTAGNGYDLNETWSYDPATNLWTNLTLGGGPLPRSAFGMVYDIRADLVLLFGGRNVAGTFYSDTWTYNLTTNAWTQLAPANPPSPRASFGMVYDSVVDRVIVFGGYSPSLLGDTWSLDLKNDTWTDLAPAAAPTPRTLPGFAYDPFADRTVLFGGNPAYFPGGINDTWTFDYAADTWTNVTSGTAPPARLAGTMAANVSAHRVILFGGESSSGFLNDTWEYETATNTWTNVTSGPSPPRVIDAGMACCSTTYGRFLMFGGIPDPGAVRSFWYFDRVTSNWTNLGTPMTVPARAFESVAYDSGAGVLVLFGGITVAPGGTAVTGETWTFNLARQAWAERTPLVSPKARANASMEYDPIAGRIVLFGGGPSPGVYWSDTWSFILGTDTWTNVTTPGPSSRGGAAMVYDAHGDRMVLFGGHGPGGYLGDTWTYNVGTRTWTNVTPPGSPSPRTAPSMAYSLASNVTVLFGGHGPSGDLNDTWSFNLATKTWTVIDAMSPPLARGFGGMAYDAAHDRFILFGGTSGFGPFSDTTEYDYVHLAWHPLLPATWPAPRGAFGMAYDLQDARTILVGGFNGSGIFADTWSYAYPNPASAPQNLSAVASVGQVTLKWSPPNSDGGAAITAYILHRGTASGAETPGTGIVGATTYADTYVTGGTTYYYEIAAFTIAGEGALSAEVSATPPVVPDTVLPTIVIVTPADGANLTSTFAIAAGRASDNVAVAKVEVRADGGPWSVMMGTNTWAGCVTLRVGANVIEARATDTSGNANTTSITVTVLAPPSSPFPGWFVLVVVLVPLAAIAGAVVTYLILRRRKPPPTAEPPKPPEP